MSYSCKVEYEIIPKESYQIIRNCSCGGKTLYINTNNFRVNANGNRIDIWLIYQCKKCKHTYNLSIYEREKVNNIPVDCYKRFLENDVELARKYGMDKSLFAKNKAEIDWSSITYELTNTVSEINTPDEKMKYQAGDYIRIRNPYGLKIRIDKIIAPIFSITRSQVKKLIDCGIIKVYNNDSSTIEIYVREDIASIDRNKQMDCVEKEDLYHYHRVWNY